MFKKISRHHWQLLFFVLGTVLLSGVVISAVALVMTIHALQIGNVRRAERGTRLATPVFWGLNTLTAHRIPDLELTAVALQTLSQTPALASAAQGWATGLTATPSTLSAVARLKQQLTTTEKQLQRIAAAWPHATLVQRLLTGSQIAHITTALPVVQQALPLAQQLLSGHHKFIILFQNSEELRATGGFMGSYAVVELQDGIVGRLQIYDIYDADGQFHGQVPAPAGLEKYLSSGHGMRLPDANWAADFPTSAQTILQFFAQSTEPNVDTIIAINLPLMQDVLRVLGPIHLPDYQVDVTASNIADVARADRQTFFPGSQQKKNFLQALFTQLKIRFLALSPSELQLLTDALRHNLAAKNILAFSPHQEWQAAFQTWQLTGEVPSPALKQPTQPPAWFLMSIESNVGINKANRAIERSAVLQLHPTASTAIIQLTLINHNTLTNPVNPSEKFHYANYQRFLFSSTTHVKTIRLNNEIVPKWDEDIITTTNGTSLKQIGLLIPVKVGEQATLTLELEDPSLTSSEALAIQKQPGLASYSITIRHEKSEQTVTLDRDLYIPLPK